MLSLVSIVPTRWMDVSQSRNELENGGEVQQLPDPTGVGYTPHAKHST